MRYFIHKTFRDSNEPYCGPTCELAGVEPGRFYDSYDEAMSDAAKLTAVNPVGFSIKLSSDPSRQDLYSKGYEQGKEDAIKRAIQCILWSMQAKGSNIHPAAKAAFEDALSTVRTAYMEGSSVMGESE